MNTSKLRPLAAMAAAALLAGTMGAALANDPPKTQGGMDKATERESSQPAKDTWITTKVKADLLATEGVSGLELNVETVEGVVALSGEVDTRAEADKAAEVARGIEGVTRVDTQAIKVRNKTP